MMNGPDTNVAEFQSWSVAAPYRLVLIEWVDASRLNEAWIDLAAIPEPYPHRCVTVGYVVSENEHAKIIVPTVGDTEHVTNRHTYGGMMIPVAAIIAEREIAPATACPTGMAWKHPA